jgi:putative transposase
LRGPENEAQPFHRRTDYRGIEGAVCRKLESQVGGMEVSEVKRLKALEDENTKLKRLLADAMLGNAALKDLLAKKW